MCKTSHEQDSQMYVQLLSTWRNTTYILGAGFIPGLSRGTCSWAEAFNGQYVHNGFKLIIEKEGAYPDIWALTNGKVV